MFGLFKQSQSDKARTKETALLLGAVKEAALSLAREEKIETFWIAALKGARWFLPTTRACVCLYNGDRMGEVVIRLEGDTVLPPLPDPVSIKDEPFSEKEGRPHLFVGRSEAATDPFRQWLFQNNPDIVSCPLWSQGTHWGVLFFVLHSKKEGDASHLTSLCALYAAQVAVNYTLLKTATALAAANRALEAKTAKANDALREFIDVALHDLKIPLPSILSLLAWMEEDVTDPDQTREYLARLQRRIKSMDEMIEALLQHVHSTLHSKGENGNVSHG